jgi:DNA polymerase III subunit delta'
VVVSDPWGIVGHERAVDLLRRAVQSRRIGHAYLISGPLGVGKRTLALRLAQALNCERLGPGAPGASPAGNPLSGDDGADTSMPPCGACRRCRLIASEAHPEVRVVSVQAPHRVIRVADVESIQADAALRAADVYRKVYVLEQAELLHPDAANRLLKTIEEPPSSVVMILTTIDPQATLETIVSRCQHLRLRPLKRDRLTAHLADVTDLAQDRAELIAALADGCVGRAMSLATDERALERRSRILDELAVVLDGDRIARLQYARTLGDRWSKDQDGIREILNIWLRWWRDLLLVHSGLDGRVVNLDRRAELGRMARLVSPSEAGAAVECVRDTLQMLDQNVNARLALDVVTLDLPRAERVA